jgi:hypothetical protein
MQNSVFTLHDWEKEGSRISKTQNKSTLEDSKPSAQPGVRLLIGLDR